MQFNKIICILHFSKKVTLLFSMKVNINSFNPQKKGDLFLHNYVQSHLGDIKKLWDSQLRHRHGWIK